jgi:RNA polymerase sigma-70 factor (ECF subfamily)
LVRLGAPARDLEDLAQDVLVIALARQDAFDDRRALYPWRWGIARNRLRDHRARHRHRAEVSDDASLVTAAAAPADGDRLLADTLCAALRQLPDDQQLLVVLHDLEAWTVPECAGALGITTDTAKYRIATARQALRDQLARQNLPPRSA